MAVVVEAVAEATTRPRLQQQARARLWRRERESRLRGRAAGRLRAASAAVEVVAVAVEAVVEAARRPRLQQRRAGGLRVVEEGVVGAAEVEDLRQHR